MYGPGDVTYALEALKLDLLEIDWANQIWSEKFQSCPEELPVDYSERFSLLNAEETLDVLDKCSDIIKQWLNSDSKADWPALSDVPYSNLLALLFYYISNAQTEKDDFNWILLGIKSAKLYLNLIRIPGSNAYKIFQILIFEPSLKLFTISKLFEKKSDGDGKSTSNLNTLPRQQILKSLNDLLIEFKTFIPLYSFKNQPEALSATLTALSELTRCDRFVKLDDFLMCNDASSLTVLSRNAYLTLKELCSELHGRDIDRLVLFHLLPNFTILGGLNNPEFSTYSANELTIIRSRAFWFLKTHLITKGEEMLTQIRVLVQQICRAMDDRTDYRNKATDLVISIISLFGEKHYFSMLRWIFKQAFHDNATNRVIALGLLSKLIFVKQGNAERSNMGDSGHSTLTNSPNSHFDPSQNQMSSIEVSNLPSSHGSSEMNSEGLSDSDFSVGQARIISFSKPVEYLPLEYRRMMLAILINRCQDLVVQVRCQAMKYLNYIIPELKSPTIQKLVRSVFVDPYTSETEIKFNDDEMDFLSSEQFREVLDKQQWDDVSHEIIPGATKFFESLIKKYEDEITDARKRTVTLIGNIFFLNPQWMSRINLFHYGQYCRDPALCVRKEALTQINILTLHYSQHSELIRIWIQEVLTKIADRDIGVCELAATTVAKTILDNIKPLHLTKLPSDLIPWNLITHIAALKNQVFLTKCFNAWKVSKTDKFNENKLSSVLSHIGSAQNAPCWVLLASSSVYFDIKKSQPIMDYFINVTAKGEPYNVSYLVLVTLNHCCHTLTTENKKILENELLDSVQNQTTSFELIPLVVKLRANLRHLLSENENAAKRELAKWAVELTEKGEKHIESSLNSENELIASSCLYSLSLIASISPLLPGQISQSTAECILKFIKTPKSSDNVELIKLQAFAILALGRISLTMQPLATSLVDSLTNYLTHCRNSTILNNSMVTLADIGERFPHLIDNYFPAMMLCLKHRSRETRKTALEITIELLQEGYVRPEGPIIFNLMTLIHDPARHTSSTVKIFLVNSYLDKIRAPSITVVKIMFFYNKYRGHAAYNKNVYLSPEEDAAFNFSGSKMHGKRLAIYRFLISRISVSSRLKLLLDIAKEVLSGVDSDTINVSSMEGEQIVLDTFGLLMSKFGPNVQKKKAGAVAAAAAGEEGEDEGEEEAEDVKIAYIRSVLDLCIKIRSKFFKRQKLHHRFYFYVRELVRERPKEEIMEYFQENPGFGHEILHEIEKYPKQDWNEDFLEEAPFNMDTSHKNVEDPTRKRKSDEHLTDGNTRKKSKEPEMDVQSDGELHELDEDGQNGEINGEEARVGSEEEPENVESNNPPLQSDANRLADSLDSLKLRQLSVKLIKLPESKLPSGRNLRKPSAKGNQEETTDKKEVAKGRKKRTVRSSSDNLDNSNDLGLMLPPLRQSRTSRRTTSTPTPSTSNRNCVPPLFSSTPLISKPNGFNATEISPVVQNNSCDDKS